MFGNRGVLDVPGVGVHLGGGELAKEMLEPVGWVEEGGEGLLESLSSGERRGQKK